MHCSCFYNRKTLKIKTKRISSDQELKITDRTRLLCIENKNEKHCQRSEIKATIVDRVGIIILILFYFLETSDHR